MKTCLVFFSLIIHLYSFSQLKNQFKGKWIEIKKDKEGYLMYKPCDGDTQFIEVKGKEITIHKQIEETKYTIISFQKRKENKFFHCRDDYGNFVDFSVKRYEKNKNFMLWTWTLNDKNSQKFNFIMLTVNIKNTKDLRKVENPCIDNKKKEFEFLPITN